jgi:hypothetical protein
MLTSFCFPLDLPWSERHEEVKNFQRLLVTPQAEADPGFVKFVNKMVFPLVLNCNERTALSKDVCRSICLVAETLSRQSSR